MPANPPSKKYTCSDYRDEMRLMGLRKRLESETLSPGEIEELLKEISRLETAMGMG